MPARNVGDIVSGKELGKPGKRFLWSRCPDCGEERWQQYKPSNPGSIRRCRECHTQHTRRLFKLHKGEAPGS
jgi:hypothetical protein